MQIGGGNLYDKAAALRFLASRCEGLVFVGMMAFQIMQALGLAVPFNLVEHGAVKEAFSLVQFVQCRNIPILYPKDFLCMNIRRPDRSEIFPAHGILDGEFARASPLASLTPSLISVLDILFEQTLFSAQVVLSLNLLNIQAFRYPNKGFSISWPDLYLQCFVIMKGIYFFKFLWFHLPDIFLRISVVDHGTPFLRPSNS